MPDSWSCRDCPPDNVITDQVYRVQRREHLRDAQGRIVQAVTSGDYDIYCKVHYERREAADEI